MAGPQDASDRAKPKPVSGPPAPGKTAPARPRPPVQSRQQKRKQLLERTVDAVHAGTFDEATGASVLRKAGFPDAKNPFAQPDSGGLVGAVANLPRGVKTALTPRRKGVLAQQDIERAKAGGVNAGLVAPGTGLIAQFVGPLAQAAVNTPGGGVGFVEHPVGTSQRIAEHLSHPNLVEDVLLGYLALHGGAAGALRAKAAKEAVTSGAGKRAAVTRSAQEGGSLLHTPRAQPVPITIQGQRLEGPVTAAGEVPRAPGVTFERPVVQNPLVRPLSRARSRRIEKALNDETPARDLGVPVGRGKRVGKRTDAKLRGTFSAANTAGRELRAQARARSEIENAHGAALHRFTSGLSPAERDAMTVVAISGDHAFTDPAGAIAQQVAAHAHWIGVGGDPVRNAEHIASIQAAQKVLENPSSKFLRALGLAQDVSRGTEASLLKAGLLEPGTAAGRQAKVADLYGYDAPPEGSFYFPLAERYQNTGITPAGSFETRPSQFGAGPPAMGTRIPGVKQTFTGGSVASGRLPNVGEALAKRATQVNNALAVRRQYDELWRIGRPEKRSEFDIPVRDTNAIQDDLRKFMSDLSQADVALDADATAALIEGKLIDLAKLLEGGLKDAYGGRPVGPASRIDGVRWVDSRLVSPNAPSVKGNVFKAADAITNPIRFTQLYARPAYILNLAGNLGMNGISEGARVFPALKWAVTAQKRLPGDVMREIDGGMGVSLSRIYSIGRGPLGKLNDKAAEMWNRITDMHSRRAAFSAEAAREGFRTDSEVVDLMTNPANEAARTRVFRQANKNIVDYSSLTPFERDEVRRLIYFYPWVSRGTIWTLRTMVEHPYKTFTMFELGQIGAENANKKLGEHQPKWIAETGLVPVGASHKGLQKVINPSSLWTPTTAVQAFSAAADTAEAALGLPHTASGAGDLLTPAATLLTQASTRYEGGAQATGLKGLAESVPFYQAGRRSGLYGGPSKTYPAKGVDQAVGPLVVGGLFPRPLSLEQAGRQAVNQVRSPRAKLAIQIDQAAELGLLTRDEADAYLKQLPDVDALKVTSARRKLTAALKEAYAAQAAG